MCAPLIIQGQIQDSIPVLDYLSKKEYEIGGITVKGANFSDENALKSIAGLRVGDKIILPGEKISRALKALWNLKLFTDVQIFQEKTAGEIIFSRDSC